MSNIDKQWLQQKIADMEAARDEIPFGLDDDDSNTLAALRIALASLEAEPVAWRHFQKTPTYVGYWILNDYKPNCSGVEPLYTAPPAPVALPVQHWEELCRQNPDMSIGDAIIRAAWWNHCAAMLQASEHVTTAYKLPEGYALVPVEPTYQMCEAMGLPWESPRFPDRYKAMIAAAPQQQEVK